MQVLVGHISQATAYEQPDYPYSFSLRCKRRCWIETKAEYGQRFVTQTSNPRKGNEVWNNPKYGIYQAVIVMFLNPENNHLETSSLHQYAGEEAVNSFEEKYSEYLNDYQRAAIEKIKLLNGRDWTIAPTAIKRIV